MQQAFTGAAQPGHGREQRVPEGPADDGLPGIGVAPGGRALPHATLPGQSSRHLAAAMGRVDQHRLSALLGAVEAAVVPRLLAMHARPQAVPAVAQPGGGLAEAPPRFLGLADRDNAAPASAPASALAQLLVDALLAEDKAGAQACVSRCLARSGSGHLQAARDAACLGLLSDAARRLGELWVEDRCSFGEVTLAALGLHGLLRGLLAQARHAARPVVGRALLLAVPGEQHSLGLAMLAGFFRNAGWQVQSPAVAHAGDVARLVGQGSFDVVGFSLGAEMHLSRLGRCIEAVRGSPGGGAALVMAGGPALLDRPDLARRLGADTTAPDAASALQQVSLRRATPQACSAATPQACSAKDAGGGTARREGLPGTGQDGRHHQGRGPASDTVG